MSFSNKSHSLSTLNVESPTDNCVAAFGSHEVEKELVSFVIHPATYPKAHPRQNCEKDNLLQTPGIEPGTVCAANGAYVATIVRQKS
jgi:hypothetical protein